MVNLVPARLVYPQTLDLVMDPPSPKSQRDIFFQDSEVLRDWMSENGLDDTQVFSDTILTLNTRRWMVADSLWECMLQVCKFNNGFIREALLNDRVGDYPAADTITRTDCFIDVLWHSHLYVDKTFDRLLRAVQGPGIRWANLDHRTEHRARLVLLARLGPHLPVFCQDDIDRIVGPDR